MNRLQCQANRKEPGFPATLTGNEASASMISPVNREVVMSQPYPLRIDAYAHIIPPRYNETLYKISPKDHDKKVGNKLPLWNLEERFKIMDRYGELVQVITLGWPVIEPSILRCWPEKKSGPPPYLRSQVSAERR